MHWIAASSAILLSLENYLPPLSAGEKIRGEGEAHTQGSGLITEI